MTSVYDETFYDDIRPGAEQSAREIVPFIIDLVRPSSVVDVGCGTGDWLKGFLDAGITDVLGIDGPWAEPRHLTERTFLRTDLTSDFSVSRAFDLVLSLEVAEHLPPGRAEAFVVSLVRLGQCVLFSAAIPEQGGTEHVNEQWPTYWAELFKHHDYVAVDCVRPYVWTSALVEWWYAQNMILYVAREALDDRPALATAAARTDIGRLNVVHPRSYLNKVRERNMAYVRPDAAKLSASAWTAVAPRVFANAILRRLGRR